MSGVSSNRNNRDQALDFLRNLQDWEQSLKEKDKKLKGHVQEGRKMVSSAQKIGNVGEDKGPARKDPRVEVKKPLNAVQSKIPFANSHDQRQYDYFRNSDAFSRTSSSLLIEESFPDAASEKELGNEYFKQKKFKEAIECYSRSIALSPSSVAFANRAMAYIKMKRFEEAENDCTEALNLDDRYIKAYSRRATARKELGKLKLSVEDSEFALRLEPNNQELKKLYTEVKTLYNKEMIKKTSDAIKNSMSGEDSNLISSRSQGAGVTAVEADHIKDSNRDVLGKPSILMNEMESRATSVENKSGEQQCNASHEGAAPPPGSNSSKLDFGQSSRVVDRKDELNLSMQELASRAASQALAAAAKNISTPKSAYEFEVSWRALSDDQVLQARLLKTIPPTTLPHLFKNALSAPILIEIIKCLTTFFMEETVLAVDILDNLTKVARFDMIIMCLSTKDKADLHKIWDEIFSNQAVLAGHTDIMRRLRTKYLPGGGWQMQEVR